MERRRRIMEAAKACIAEYGHGASISCIAGRAGVSKALFFYYFEDKAAVTEAIGTEISADYLEEVNRSLLTEPPAERVFAVIRHHLRFVATNPTDALFLYNSAEKPGTGETLHQPGIFYHNLFLVIRAAIEAGIATGDFKPIDAEEYAYVLLASLHGLGRLKLFDYIREYDVTEHLIAFFGESLRARHPSRP
jgi:AcrR family transcriptional regulator